MTDLELGLLSIILGLMVGNRFRLIRGKKEGYQTQLEQQEEREDREFGEFAIDSEKARIAFLVKERKQE